MKPQQGMTLMELLVAMALGAVLLLTLTQFYSHARRAYTMQTEQARLQENARLALTLIGREVRMAGYLGCDPAVALTTTASSPPDSPGAAHALRGYEDGAGWTASKTVTRVAGSDVLRVIRAAPGRSLLAADMASTSAALSLTVNGEGLATNDRLIVSDCVAADLFCASAVSGLTVQHATACNSNAALSRAYPAGAQVMAYAQTQFFIGINPSGRAALYQVAWNGSSLGSAQEWVEGVADLQLRLGLDTNGDGEVDSEVAPAAVSQWEQVKRVRVSLLMEGAEPVLDAGQTLEIDGVARSFSDRKLRQVYRAEMALRNRLY